MRRIDRLKGSANSSPSLFPECAPNENEKTFPNQRVRNGRTRALTYDERCLIEKGCKEGLTWEQISHSLPRRLSKFTIRNETIRRGGKDAYKAKDAQQQAEERQALRAEKLRKYYRDFPDKSPNPHQIYRDRVEKRLYAIEEQLKVLWDGLTEIQNTQRKYEENQ